MDDAENDWIGIFIRHLEIDVLLAKRGDATLKSSLRGLALLKLLLRLLDRGRRGGGRSLGLVELGLGLLVGPGGRTLDAVQDPPRCRLEDEGR